jgi:hypothetical protein
VPRLFQPGEGVWHRPRQQGPIVIRAFVQARLLGLKLLTLDACVVVSDNNPGTATSSPLSVTGLDVSDRSAMSRVMPPGSETSLAYAMRLLEQGIHALEDSRRLRLRDRFGMTAAWLLGVAVAVWARCRE